jgi:hypothetical protein
MPQKYLHYYGNESSKSLLEEYGLVDHGIQLDQLKPINCTNCNEPNKPNSKFCAKCRMVLTYDEVEKMSNSDQNVLLNVMETGILSLPSYTYEEFCEIIVKLTERRDGQSEEKAMKIADTVWNKLNSRDIRDVIRISKLTKSIEDVEFVANTLQKYKRKSED